ncbi:MAG: DegT/DnrJ/EryC1/StrS family aminotransferase [Candidatus Coatesbacteria bacterium]|nr:MAG: DegT/DnrJ/EryC1/StrS family aminotransferase [Candidatus Coatesbacteria bacterium]
MYARIKPLLDSEGVLALAELPSEELIKIAEEYRRRLCELTGAAKAYTVTSGRGALVLALRSLGVDPGDEVVIPALTCTGVADAVLSLGAVPHLCDVSPRTLSLRPAGLKRILARKKTRAVVDSPLLGTVPQMEETADVCNVTGVPLVVDVAQSVGCTRLGKNLASYGQMAIISTNIDKPFTTGRGGALLVMSGKLTPGTDAYYLPCGTQKPDEEVKALKGLAISDRLLSSENYEPFTSIDLGFAYAAAEGDAYDLTDLLLGAAGDRAAAKAKAAADKLMPVERLSYWGRFKRRFNPSSAVPGIGPPEKLGPLLSSVGGLHLELLEEEGERRRRLADIIDRELTGFPATEAAYWDLDESDSAWPLRYPVLLNDYRERVNVVTRCSKAGYEVGNFIYPRPLSNHFPYFKLSRYAGRYLRGAWRTAAGMVNLPLHHEMTPGDAEKVARVLKG